MEWVGINNDDVDIVTAPIIITTIVTSCDPRPFLTRSHINY